MAKANLINFRYKSETSTLHVQSNFDWINALCVPADERYERDTYGLQTVVPIQNRFTGSFEFRGATPFSPGRIDLGFLTCKNLKDGVEIPCIPMSKQKASEFITALVRCVKQLYMEHLKPFEVSASLTMTLEEV